MVKMYEQSTRPEQSRRRPRTDRESEGTSVIGDYGRQAKVKKQKQNVLRDSRLNFP
jgi:hypothetical protein